METIGDPLIEMVAASISARGPRMAPVLDAVTWKVMRGDFWVVCGSPGSGKSDLLLTAAGLLRPTSGGHRLFGRNLPDLGEDEIVRARFRVGFVFGNDGRLFHDMTVSENVAFPLCYHRNCSGVEVRERVSALIEITGLRPHIGSRPGSLNRCVGLKVALARALVLDPEILFLDEPLNGAGPRETTWWLEFLAKLRSGEILSEHPFVTVVVGTSDVRPWVDTGSHFALLHKHQFNVVGGRAEVNERSGRLAGELYSGDVSVS